LRDWLVAEKITVCFAPSPVAELLMTLKWPPSSALRVLLTGADTLHRYPPVGLPFQVFNNYGPTECTVVSTSALLPEGKSSRHLPPVGRPIAGTKVYIVDEDEKEVEPGAEGEVCISGPGLARGYRNDPGLNAQKFISNPFSLGSGARLYRTGDIGRILPDGQLDILGRTDDQIKILGARVEPGEIEAVLNANPCVQKSAVIGTFTLTGDKRLVAFIERNPWCNESADLRSFLKEQLPDFMIPSAFIELPELPLTSSGKIDRTLLRNLKLELERTIQTNALPSSRVELRVTEILSALLRVERISIEDNFFTLGGHSLLGTQFIARIRDAYGVELSLRYLFESPTIAAIAREIERLLDGKLNRQYAEGVHPPADAPTVAQGGF